MEQRININSLDNDYNSRVDERSDLNDSSEEKEGKNNKVLNIILSVLVFILPLIFVSTLFVDAGSLKAFVVLSVIYSMLFIWAVTRLKGNTFSVPFNLLSGSMILIALVSVVSGIFSDNFSVAFWGRDFGFDNSFYLISLFLFLFIGSFILKEIKAASYTYAAFLFSTALVFLFHILLILFPQIMPDFNFFFSNTQNTIGKWFDLGVFSGLVTIMSLLSISFLKTDKRIKITLQVLLGLSLALLLVIGFVDLWVVVGVSSLLIFVYLIMADKTSGNKKIEIPVSVLVVIIISSTVLLAGYGSINPINTKIQSILDINFVDVRPAPVATYEVVKSALIESPIIGRDFTTFDQAWVQYKPDSINLTELWGTDFRYGYGLIPSYFATTGALGIISWLLFFATFIYLGFSNIFRENKNTLSKYILVSSFFSAMYLWAMAFVYIPSHVTLFLTFLFSAVFIGSLYREKLLNVKQFSISQNPKYGFLYIFFVVILLIISITSVYNLVEKFASQVYARQSAVAFQLGDIDKAYVKIIDAISFTQNDILFKNLSDIEQTRAVLIQNDTSLPEGERSTLFESSVSSAIQASYAAIEYDSNNYSNLYYTGFLFSNLIGLNIEGVADRAIEFLDEAKRLNPKNPEIPLSLARIYLAQEDFERSKDLINESIRIKSNYTNAVYLLARINVAEGEVDKAIENVRLTTLIRPNDPVTYFQLGLLQYQNRNFSDSVISFESALSRDRFYANAKYFLGLSYYEVGRRQDAIDQFDQLSQTNPDNQEVQFILSNLRSGLSPFAGAETNIPPIDSQPGNRDTPPLDDDQTGTADPELETVPELETEVLSPEISE